MQCDADAPIHVFLASITHTLRLRRLGNGGIDPVGCCVPTLVGTCLVADRPGGRVWCVV
jgi:hypothetical protein